MNLTLENKHKKSFVRLVLLDGDKNEVERELGFATKIYIPEKEDVLLITSPSIFPDNIDTCLDDIAIHRWMPKPKQRNPPKVKNIENHKQADVCTVVFEGDDKKYSLPYEVLTEEKIKQHKKLTACVFDGKKKIELQFENQGGSYKLSKVTKEGFDVKRAKGAPLIIHEQTHAFMGAPRFARKIVGVLSIDSNGEMYPVLFKEGFLDERPSRSDIADPGPSRHSEEDVYTEKPSTGGDERKRNYYEDSKKLKEAVKNNTEYQSKSMAAHDVMSARTDDIFTNLTIYYADKKEVKEVQTKEPSLIEHLRECTKRKSGAKVKKCEDVFGGNPKRLLLTGKPGIGKTLFCEKIMRDWSMNRLFQNEDTPNIKFAYLLKFRQLSKFSDTEMNLQELLNCSPLLDINSKIDDSLFEYLTKNPSEVLIILDGFDEYSQQNRNAFASDDCELEHDYTKKMPIPALCSQLIKGKFLRNSIVLVSSRPGEARELGEINFDRYVEISSLSPKQVIEYVEKYFSEPEQEQTRNTAREHVEKHQNLVSLCHNPLLSFLLCWCLERRISQSGLITEKLPAKSTDLYDEVVKVAVQKLHENLRYVKMTGNTMKMVQDTLDKLEKLAANLLRESKYIFDEEDMKKQSLTENEIESLKVSGLLHHVPGTRISGFQTKSEFSFIHLSLQEYLAASFFVKNNEIPRWDEITDQTFVFMSGLCSREKDGNLMEDIICHITPMYIEHLFILHCLYEYGDDYITKLTINEYQDFDSEGVIYLDGLTDVDVKCFSYLLDIMRSLKEQYPQSSSVYALDVGGSLIHDSFLTSFGVGVICDAFVRNSFMTGLTLEVCSLDDKCVERIADSLVNTGITYLKLWGNNITDKGVESICSVLTETKITYLNLSDNKITDKGAESICRVIIRDDCPVESLYLKDNKIITKECKNRVKQLVQEHKPGVILYI